MTELETLTLRFLDDEVTEEELSRLARMVEGDAASKARFVTILSTEAALRGLRTLEGSSEEALSVLTVDQIRQKLAQDIEVGVMQKIRARGAGSIERLSPWLGSRAAWLAAAAALVMVAIPAVRFAAVAAAPVRSEELLLVGQFKATPGRPAPLRAILRDAPLGEIIADQSVSLALTSPDGRSIWRGHGKTDDTGAVSVSVPIPDGLADGEYLFTAQAEVDGEALETSRKLSVKRSYRVYLSADKPRYQPGQVIHLRSLALAVASGRPAAGRPVLFEIQDGKGNKVFKKSVRASRFGIASTDFTLASLVNEGEFTARATVGDTVSERTLTVERYRLPKFRVALSTDKGFYKPGETVRGEVTATYTFGEPVINARVSVVAAELVESLRPFETVSGTTDDAGRYRFELTLKDHFVGTPLEGGRGTLSFRASVTDETGHTQERELTRVVSVQPIEVALVPESGALVPGVDNLLYVITSRPDGTPVSAVVRIEGPGLEVTTDHNGFAALTLPRDAVTTPLVIAVRGSDGAAMVDQQEVHLERNPSGSVLLRTDKAVYRTGETLHLSAIATGRASRLFVDVVQDGRTVSTASLDLSAAAGDRAAMGDSAAAGDRAARGKLAIDLPSDVTGTLAVSAYHLPVTGEIVRDTKIVQVVPAQELDIQAVLDASVYRPGETAILDVTVRRGGAPAVAALSLVGVDEAVFALSEMRPGLEKVYFALQEELLTPRYELHGHRDLSPHLLVEPATPISESQRQSQAPIIMAAAVGTGGPTVVVGESYEQRLGAHRETRQSALELLVAVIAFIPTAVFALLIAFVLGYGGYRLLRPAETLTLADEARSELDRDFRWFCLAWVLGVSTPLPAALITGMTSRSIALTVLVSGALVTVFAGAMFQKARRLRRREALARLPLLRRVLVLAPVSYFTSVLAVCALLTAADLRMIRSSEALIAFLVVGMVLASLIAVAVLATAARTLLVRTSWPGRLGFFFGRLSLAVIPTLALMGLFLTMMMGGAERVAVLDEPVDMAEVVEAGVRSAVSEPARPKDVDSGSGGLIAPSRIRRHFPETLLFMPEIITDEEGHARVEIPLADSITTWRLGMSAVDREGALGAKTESIRVFQEFFVDLDLPVALTQNDEVEVPVAVYSYLDRPQTVRVELESAPWFASAGATSHTLRLGPREITHVSFRIAAKKPGTHALTVRASGSAMADAVQRTIRVEPDGEPIVETLNGRLEGTITARLAFPESSIRGASQLRLKLYPGAFSQVVEGLDGLFRMPYGCFEQTSSTTYPNVLVLDYLRATKQVKPELEMKARGLIQVGYQRLLSFEVSGGGFEWFGKAPAHRILTAYGLLEFSDMAKVFEVDPAVLERTGTWLLEQQRADGSWEPDEGGIAEGAINAYRGQTLRTTAYVTWAIAAAKLDPARLARAFEYVDEKVSEVNDPYTLALVANARLAADRDAGDLLDRLAALAKRDDGGVFWTSAAQGITHSAGDTLTVETTALVASAFLAAGYATDTAHAALGWLVAEKDPSGTWLSTQATVAAMRALLAGSKSAGTSARGTVHVAVRMNGAGVHTETITPETSDVFRTIDLGRYLQVGDNSVELTMTGRGNFAYQLVGTHYLPWPPEGRPETEKPLTIDVVYDTHALAEGDLLHAQVTVTYQDEGTANMTLLDLGIPPGFELLPEAFETMKSSGIIERFSVNPRQVILYFRELESGKPVTFRYALRAKYPLRVKTPPSTAYQYYEPKVRDEAEPVELTVR